MPNEDRYFEFPATDADNGPIVNASFQVKVPKIVDDELVTVDETLNDTHADKLGDGREIRILPDSRVLHAREPIAVDALSQHPLYVEIDPPQGERKRSTPKPAKTEQED